MHIKFSRWSGFLSGFWYLYSDGCIKIFLYSFYSEIIVLKRVFRLVCLSLKKRGVSILLSHPVQRKIESNVNHGIDSRYRNRIRMRVDCVNQCELQKYWMNFPIFTCYFFSDSCFCCFEIKIFFSFER